MKIRIKDNSIRLRLSKTEVDNLCKNGRVQASTQISTNLQFIYSLKINSHWGVRFQDNLLEVLIPDDLILNWSSNEIVGFDTVIDNNDNGLKLLVEKDFKCLTPRDENEEDHYENPLEKHNC